MTDVKSPSDIDINEALAALNSVIEGVSQASAPALARLAEYQSAHLARRGEIGKRLAAELGEDHPRVAALKAGAAQAGRLAAAFDVAARRTARVPQIKAHEWMAYGRVVDAGGRPLSGVRVRVYDRDRKYDDLLGDTTTDEFGDFHVIYHERDFMEAGEGLPELYVMVHDARGNLLYSSRDAFRAESGRVEYFEIVLDT